VDNFFQDSKSNTISGAGDDGPETEKLVQLFVQRCQQNLLALNKFVTAAATSKGKSKPGGKTEKADWAKQLYSLSLQLPPIASPEFLTELCRFVDTMAKEMQRLK
jgi:hypothetical protein